jgi:hypothetical protein
MRSFMGLLAVAAGVSLVQAAHHAGSHQGPNPHRAFEKRNAMARSANFTARAEVFENARFTVSRNWRIILCICSNALLTF